MMTFPERMAAIRACLETRILPAVGRDSRSELRAIIKLMDDMADEIDRGPLAMQDELAEMLSLCSAVAVALQMGGAGSERDDQLAVLQTAAAEPVHSLTELAALHPRACMVIGGLAVALAAQVRASGAASDRALLHRCYTTLHRHAAARAEWQSIFAEGGLFGGDSVVHFPSGAAA